MQKRKFSLQDFKGGRVLSREEMKQVLGGSAPAGRCVIVYSTQGYSDCYYTTGSAWDLCYRVYGSHCEDVGDNVPCAANNCVMN